MTTRFIAVLLLAAATGCIDNYASLRISAACAPPAPSDTGACVYSSSCESVWMANLWVDPSYAGIPPSPTDGTLYWPFQVDNQRPPNGDRDGATNTATAFITGFRISYFSATVSIPDAVIEDTTRTVEAESSTVVGIPVMPSTVSSLLAIATLVADVRAEIRATGLYGDGTTFETGPFSVVVNVVNGAVPGAFCPDPAAPVLVGVCPQLGQSAVYLCKAP